MATAQIALSIPQAKPATLYYEHAYQHGGGRYDYLHMIRSRSLFALANWRPFEDTYWSTLDANRRAFAQGLKETFDVIIDSPSNRCFHRPFLAAFLHHHQGSPCIRFTKATSANSNPGNRVALSQGISLAHAVNGAALANVKRVLIVDDVFSTGTIASILVEQLVAAGLNAVAEITVAAPLRVTPPPAGSDADIVLKMMAGQ